MKNWIGLFPLKHIFFTEQTDRHKTFQKTGADIIVILVTIIISCIGIMLVYNSSVVIALRDFSDQYYYVREQLRGLVIGLIGFTVFSSINYHTLQKIALPLLIGTLVLLLAVFIPGLGIQALGAHRWIHIGGVVLQPAELAKLSLIIYLATWFSVREKGRLLPFLLLLGMVDGLIVIEPDLGTSVIVASIACVMYFCSGAPLKHFLWLIPICIVIVLILSIVSPYRYHRLLSFINPQKDPLGSSYQIRQAMIAVGSGGWVGVGLGKSRQKYEYLPEANTDSIFAILAEETGFVGSLGMIMLFILLLWRIFRIARNASDIFGRVLAIGILSWIGIQTACNIAANIALMPLTGIPLPLISYGGSSLVITLAAMGIILNVSKYCKEDNL